MEDVDGRSRGETATSKVYNFFRRNVLKVPAAKRHDVGFRVRWEWEVARESKLRAFIRMVSFVKSLDATSTSALEECSITPGE
jgi:hypothetical protein